MVNIENMTPELARELAFSDKEKQEIKKAMEMDITFDQDCPEVTPEKALGFRRVNPKRSNTKGA